MNREVTTARQDLPITEVIDRLVNRHVGCLPVVDAHGWPIGVITKLDLIVPLANRVNTADEAPSWCDLAPQTAMEAMVPVVITVSEHATVGQTAAMMAAEGVHHILVIGGSKVIGMVSSLDIVRWLARNDGLLDAPLR